MSITTATNRERILDELTKLIMSSTEVNAAFILGSVSSKTQDKYSDLDFYVYSDIGFATRDYVDRWLSSGKLMPSLHYWTGLEKHRLIIEGVRIDLCWLPLWRIGEIHQWLDLFFAPDSVIKDSTGLLGAELAARSLLQPILSIKNDEAAFIQNLFNIAIQLIRGQEISARSRFTGVLESKTRLFHRLQIGHAKWREPTRNAESDLSPTQLSSLKEAAYIKDSVAFREWVVTELHAVSADKGLKKDVRDIAYDLARQLFA